MLNSTHIGVNSIRIFSCIERHYIEWSEKVIGGRAFGMMMMEKNRNHP
jgi:hypothetical protein